MYLNSQTLLESVVPGKHTIQPFGITREGIHQTRNSYSTGEEKERVEDRQSPGHIDNTLPAKYMQRLYTSQLRKQAYLLTERTETGGYQSDKSQKQHVCELGM
jgi:hypothetical protein